jgi:hypothetical protein
MYIDGDVDEYDERDVGPHGRVGYVDYGYDDGRRRLRSGSSPRDSVSERATNQKIVTHACSCSAP